MKKIKWVNVLKIILFMVCLGIILHDVYMLTIYSSITGKLCTYTWFGFLTFLIACMGAGLLYLDFDEQTKSTNSTTDQSYRKGTRK